jgi:hypothetical protein
MSTAILILAIVCMFGALGSLLVGVVGMGRTEFNKKHGNRLMRFRVGFQAAAIALLLLWALMPKK